MELPKDSVAEILCKLGVDKNFLHRTQNPQMVKEKVGQMDFN